MNLIKGFLLGVGVAYGIYYLNKKNEEGVSVLDELLADPSGFMDKAKGYAIQEAVQLVKDKVS